MVQCLKNNALHTIFKKKQNKKRHEYCTMSKKAWYYYSSKKLLLPWYMVQTNHDSTRVLVLSFFLPHISLSSAVCRDGCAEPLRAGGAVGGDLMPVFCLTPPRITANSANTNTSCGTQSANAQPLLCCELFPRSDSDKRGQPCCYSQHEWWDSGTNQGQHLCDWLECCRLGGQRPYLQQKRLIQLIWHWGL